MTWRHPSITYGAVEPESTAPPPGRRRAGWVATIIGVGLAASALSLALGGGGLALKAAAALVLELRMARPASHHPPTPHGPPRPVGYCCTTASVAPSGARIGTRGHACDACALVDKSYPVKCHSKKQKCQSPECGSGRFCAGTYKGDAPPPGGTTEGVAQVETAIPALTTGCRSDADCTFPQICVQRSDGPGTCGGWEPGACVPACVHPFICHLGHCLGGVEESGAENTMMNMNSVTVTNKEIIDNIRTMIPTIKAPEHMKYT